jgi:ABC-2 type transport system ATP-binding protein
MIQVQNLTFEYADKRALENVSFEITDGAITALVGPNGSGKTTLLRCLASLSKPMTGSIKVNGYDAIAQPREVHLQVGYLQDLFGLYDQLSVRQSIEFTAHSRLDSNADFDRAIQLAIERSDIGSFIDKKVSSLSRGMRQRVGIAQAIIHQPKVLLLDEPASGLDPEARHSLSQLLVDLRDSGMTIIVSSHILAELEDYSTEMLVIQEGKMIEHRTLNASININKTTNVVITLSENEQKHIGFISTIEGVRDATFIQKQIHVKLDESILPKRDLLKKLIAEDMPVEEFATLKINLQDEYIKTVAQYKQNKTS